MERNLLASAICVLLIVNSVSSTNYHNAAKKVCDFPDCGSGSKVSDSGTSSSTTHEVRRPTGAYADVVRTGITGKAQAYVGAHINIRDYPASNQLNVALGQGAAGGGGGMTSGQAMIIRKERNALTSEINAIKQISGKAVSALLHSNPNVTISGHANRNNVNRQKNRFVENSAGLEDALDYDSYITETALTSEEKQNVLRRYDQQQPNGNSPMTFSTASALSQLQENYRNRDPNNDPTGTFERTLDNVLRALWLPLVMPQQFDYTAAVQVNSDTQGLHHSFIRHVTDWEDVISFDRALMNRLSPVRNAIDVLESVSANTAQASRARCAIARDALRSAIRQLSEDVSSNVMTAFAEIQLLLHRFIQQNLTYENYLGRSVNDSRQVRLHFRVNTIRGGNSVMVVCLSDELFRPRSNPLLSNDTRPIRKVITVFFKQWRRDYNNTLTEGRDS